MGDLIHFFTLIYSIIIVIAQLKQQLEMRRGTFLFNLWENPPLDVYLKVYIFNITNGDAFLSGRDKKLKVVEVGPYVYQ